MEDAAAAVEEAPMPTQPVKKKKKTKKVIISSIDAALMTVDEWEPEWLKAMAALVPGFSLDKDRNLDDKAQTDTITELQEQQRENGYIEIEVTDDDEDEEEEAIRRAPTPRGRGRRSFRPGVCKKPGAGVRKLN